MSEHLTEAAGATLLKQAKGSSHPHFTGEETKLREEK